MRIMRKAACFLLELCCVALALADDGVAFKGGLWRTFEYDEPSSMPIVFGGESRCSDVCAADYCVFLDIWYDDGTAVWAIHADFQQGTHDWETTVGSFVPERPVKKIDMHAFVRNGSGVAEFRNLKLERRAEPFDCKRGVALAPKETVVWTADSMRRITPLTFLCSADAKKCVPPTAHVSLARRERESFQVQISTGSAAEWTDGGVTLPVLRNRKGGVLNGAVEWRRVGYVSRKRGCYLHPCGEPQTELWLPDPLLPPAPFKVHKGSTQGLWFTVYASPDAVAGV